jgi:hypothetical protein
VTCAHCELLNQNPYNNECWQCGTDLVTGAVPERTTSAPGYRYERVSAVDAIGAWPEKKKAPTLWERRDPNLFRDLLLLPLMPFQILWFLVESIWTGEGGGDGRTKVTS